MKNIDFFNDIKRLNSLADIGLLYCNNEHDKERYLELKEISLRLVQQMTELDLQNLKVTFPSVKDYPTAKVDVRGLLLSAENKILLVKESMDGKWSLPGGWADIGYSPKETIVKEFQEETGLEVNPTTLLAVFDKKMHPHPPQPFYVYKMVFHCLPLSQDITPGFDELDVQYFALDELPPLSEDRILESQLRLLVAEVLSHSGRVYVD